MSKAPSPQSVVIYHNPKCGKSRETLALIRAAGIEPRIVEYLKEPPSREELKRIARQMGVPLGALLRRKEAAFAAHALGNSNITDHQILDAIAAHPVLIERPIVVTAKGARLGRPPEAVREILPHKNT